MIKGELKKSADNIEIEKNLAVFVFSGSLFINGEKLEGGKGIVFSSDSDNISAQNLTCLCLTYSGADRAKLFSNIKENKIFDFTISDELLGICDLFFKNKKTYDNEMLARGIAQTVFSYIIPRESEEKISNVSEYVELAENYINENIEKSIKIDDVAAYLNISRGYLRNIFFEQNGVSPQEYMMQKRIERAEDLLKNTDLSVGEIAKKCGYDDILQFSRIFKKRALISPSEYRKQNMAQHVKDKPKIKRLKYNKNNNSINKKENIEKEIVLPENNINVSSEIKNPTEPEIYESQGDLTAILAAQIEKAARAAEEERKEKEKNPTSPLWLL